MPAVNPRRERMDEPEWDRFISDDGRLFEPRTATLSRRQAPKTARPIDVPPELSEALASKVERMLTRSTRSLGAESAWIAWVASGNAVLQEEVAPPLTQYLPWVTETLGVTRFRLQLRLLPEADSGVTCSGRFYPGQALITVTLAGLGYRESADGLTSYVYDQVVGTVTHELAHLIQAAHRERGGGPPSRKPYTLDESKAYSAELADAYASALERTPDLSVEEFVAHAPNCSHLRQLLGPRGWQRVLTDLGYVTQWHRESGNVPPAGHGVHASGGVPGRPRTQTHNLSKKAILAQRPALFTRQAQAHTTAATLFTRTALIQPARGEGVGAPSSNRRHLDEDFKDEVEAERDPDLIRHTRGVEASAAWRPGK